jgi:hypothetical protein
MVKLCHTGNKLKRSLSKIMTRVMESYMSQSKNSNNTSQHTTWHILMYTDTLHTNTMTTVIGRGIVSLHHMINFTLELSSMISKCIHQDAFITHSGDIFACIIQQINLSHKYLFMMIILICK